MGICALYIFVVKCFEILKALYKFPIIIIKLLGEIDVTTGRDATMSS